MKIDELNKNHLTADDGKVLRRLSDGWIAGNDIHLGNTYYLDGEPLPDPLWELPEHYEEIYPLDDVTDEDFDVAAEPEMLALMNDETEPVYNLEVPASRPTLADLLSKALVEIEGLKMEVAGLRYGSNP